MLLVFLSLLSVTVAFPSGAPAGTCTVWTARHGDNQVQDSLPPYQVTFDGTFVTLQADDVPFRGFFIQGRDRATGQPIGTFQPSSEGQTLDCSGEGSADSITHVNATDKTSVSFKWQAPENFQGEVRFRAIVVQRFAIFWNAVYSDFYTIP